MLFFEPLDFLARLAALVPKPRVNLTRFHGVFAPLCPRVFMPSGIYALGYWLRKRHGAEVAKPTCPANRQPRPNDTLR